MWLGMTAQLGAIAEGVGQAMAISLPITAQGREYNMRWDDVLKTTVELSNERHRLMLAGIDPALDLAFLEKSEFEKRLRLETTALSPGPDVTIWTITLSIATSILLVIGRYRLIENITTTLVAMFTLVTVGTVFALQWTQQWAISTQDILTGLSFRLPPNEPAAIAFALSAFGLIGVGASELVAYPYWCLEKGYARFTGVADSSSEWKKRALGWMRVLRWDVWGSMIVYTAATIAFYLLGAAILSRIGLQPDKKELIRTLNVMYEPVFGSWAKILFLVGAFAVLYSTFFVASAGNARICADALGVVGLASRDPTKSRQRVLWLSGLFPLISLGLFLLKPDVAKVVFLSGVLQTLMLPMLSFAALYFRYRKCDPRVAPGRIWDVCLWFSAIFMLAVSVLIAWDSLVGM